MTSGRITSSFIAAALGAAVACMLGLVLWTPSALAQSGRPLEKITFLLDFVPYGKHAPFYVAMDKGFWKDAGFDGKIVGGEGSATTISPTQPARSILPSPILPTSLLPGREA